MAAARRPVSAFGLLCLVLLSSGGLAACGDDSGGGPDASRAPDAMPPDAMPPDPVARGEYIVKALGDCRICHTPNSIVDGKRVYDESLSLSGRLDAYMGGMVSSANLTSDATGLLNWTDDEIITALRTGVRPDGRVLLVMPYYEFANYTDEDARAIVAYLRTVPPVVNDVPAPAAAILRDKPYTLIVGDYIPQTTLAADDANYARAQHGRYLASATCEHCHTPSSTDNPDLARDPSLMFTGNQHFSTGAYSKNITQSENGLAGVSAQEIANTLLTNDLLCEPMASGPGRAFGYMDPDDALDLGYYLTTIPPNDSGVVPPCPN